MKNFYPVAIFLAFVVLVEGVFFAFLAISYTRKMDDFRIREDFVASSIRQGVSNYLASVVPAPASTSVSSPSPFSSPVVLFVDLSTWFSPRGGYLCSINGTNYKPGDFTEYGLILRISDGRVFCRKGEEICILRRSPPADARRKPGAAGGGGEESEETRL